MKIYSKNTSLSVSKNIAYDKSDISEKIDALNDSLNKKFKENTEKEYQSVVFAKSFVTTV